MPPRKAGTIPGTRCPWRCHGVSRSVPRARCTGERSTRQPTDVGCAWWKVKVLGGADRAGAGETDYTFPLSQRPLASGGAPHPPRSDRSAANLRAGGDLCHSGRSPQLGPLRAWVAAVPPPCPCATASVAGAGRGGQYPTYLYERQQGRHHCGGRCCGLLSQLTYCHGG